MFKSLKEISEREVALYHNTELLLKKYRDVVWSIEVSMVQVQMNFKSEMNTNLDEFLEMAYDAGADLSGTLIQEQIRSMERNRKMLKIIDVAISLLKKKCVVGEEYYWILYYTYLSSMPCKSTDDIIRLVGEKTSPMAWKTYFTRRRKAIETLSSILWGFTSKECLEILNEFV